MPQIITRDRHGLHKALAAMGVELRYNLRATRIEYREGGPANNWLPLANTTEARIIEDIANNFHFKPIPNKPPIPAEFSRTGSWKLVLDAYMDNPNIQGDPFLDFGIRLLNDRAWDQTPRIDTALVDCLLVEDTELNRAISRNLFLSAAARARFPGCQQDEMVVLVGKQGGGKSTFLRDMLTPLNPEWYSSSVNFSQTPKEALESVQGCVWAEVQELNGLSTRNKDTAKAFISSVADNIRLPYDARAENRPRRFVLVGTANNAGDGILPNDQTGNRRYFPVDVGVERGDQPLVVDWVEANRRQLWAETFERIYSDEDWHIPYHLADAHNQQTEQFTRTDDALEDKVDGLIIVPNELYTIGQLLEMMGLDTAQGQQNKVKPLLVKRGWSPPGGGPTRNMGVLGRWWRAPTATAAR